MITLMAAKDYALTSTRIQLLKLFEHNKEVLEHDLLSYFSERRQKPALSEIYQLVRDGLLERSNWDRSGVYVTNKYYKITPYGQEVLDTLLSKDHIINPSL